MHDWPLVSGDYLGQLRRWLLFRRVEQSAGTGVGEFANHCPRCGAPVDEEDLHAEPEAPFFDVPAAVEAGSVALTPLAGTVRMSGDEHFGVE